MPKNAIKKEEEDIKMMAKFFVILLQPKKRKTEEIKAIIALKPTKEKESRLHMLFKNSYPISYLASNMPE